MIFFFLFFYAKRGRNERSLFPRFSVYFRENKGRSRTFDAGLDSVQFPEIPNETSNASYVDVELRFVGNRRFIINTSETINVIVNMFTATRELHSFSLDGIYKLLKAQ